MGYPIPQHLQLPITPYTTGEYHHFGKKLPFKKILRVTHLGDDVEAVADTPIQAIGDGEVVYAEVKPGSADHKTWGGLVVIGHTDKNTQQAFYSVYGHMYKIAVQTGVGVTAGQVIGYVAPSLTAENGWWQHPHLHFSIYKGPWKNQILPGYKRPTEFFRTRLAWWSDPQMFISRYSTT